MLAVSASDSAKPLAEESRQIVAGEAGSADKRFGLETGVWLAPIVAAEAIAACALRVVRKCHRRGPRPTHAVQPG